MRNSQERWVGRMVGKGTKAIELLGAYRPTAAGVKTQSHAILDGRKGDPTHDSWMLRLVDTGDSGQQGCTRARMCLRHTVEQGRNREEQLMKAPYDGAYFCKLPKSSKRLGK